MQTSHSLNKLLRIVERGCHCTDGLPTNTVCNEVGTGWSLSQKRLDTIAGASAGIWVNQAWAVSQHWSQYRCAVHRDALNRLGSEQQ